jgi:hypothetical protein
MAKFSLDERGERQHVAHALDGLLEWQPRGRLLCRPSPGNP